MKGLVGPFLVLVLMLFAGIAFGQAKKDAPPANSGPASATTSTMNEIYQDESHCLTEPEIRGDKDAPISCYCRDAISEARYVYFTYVLSGKDRNLNGVFLHLQQRAIETCGSPNFGDPNYDVIYDATETKDWKWNGPEVVRTYPPQEVIDRISPEKNKDGKPVSRWVPFTVQLVYRDAQKRVTRTENYSSRELEPIFPK